MDSIPLWMAAVISVSVASLIMLIIWLIVVPRQRRIITEELKVEKLTVNFNIGESSGKFTNNNQKNLKKNLHGSLRLFLLADTSPEGSPKKSNRNSALLERQLTVISENTEMQSLDNNKITAAKYVFPIQTSDKPIFTHAKETEIHKYVRPTELKIVESTANVNPTLSPSSSGVPLIMNKSFASSKSDQGKEYYYNSLFAQQIILFTPKNYR